VSPSTSGITRVEVLLSGECLGVPPDPSSRAGCAAIDAPGGVHAQLNAPASAGLYAPVSRDGGVGVSRVATWEAARPRSCSGSPREPTPGLHDDEVCVQGGVFYLGDIRLAESACGLGCGAVPERLVRISPFYYDRFEVTVARWRDALARGFQPTGMWYPISSTNPIYGSCRYNAPTADGATPMNCVSRQAAAEFCAFDGGRTLPSEAQYEFAASGRGLERYYPWGDGPTPMCNDVDYARADEILVTTPGTADVCFQMALHSLVDVGANSLDLSLDGISDLAGGVSEWTRDVTERYGVGCWSGSGMLVDPVCASSHFPYQVLRGGSWKQPITDLPVARRFPGGDRFDFVALTGGFGPHTGFRCARSGL
jgi:formylglycine-generating enzyme required for sulfatase activity